MILAPAPETQNPTSFSAAIAGSKQKVSKSQLIIKKTV
jgi:hypothetical protein